MAQSDPLTLRSLRAKASEPKPKSQSFTHSYLLLYCLKKKEGREDWSIVAAKHWTDNNSGWEMCSAIAEVLF